MDSGSKYKSVDEHKYKTADERKHERDRESHIKSLHDKSKLEQKR